MTGFEPQFPPQPDAPPRKTAHPASTRPDTMARLTASLIRLQETCRVRKCRRDGFCTGPMRRPPAEAPPAGSDGAPLPICVAKSDDETRADYAEKLHILGPMLASKPDLLLPDFDRMLTGRPRPLPPRRPPA